MRRNTRQTRKKGKTTKRRPTKSTVKHGTSKPSLTTGSLILHGIRILLSTLPGYTAISEIADFAFKSIGIIPASKLSYGEYKDTTIDIIGLGGCVTPNYVNLIGGSPLAERSMGTKNKNGLQWVNCEYLDAQLIRVNFTITPSNPQSHRAGSWCMSFTPWRSEEDSKYYAKAKAVPEYITMSHMLGAVSGPANKPLSLSYVPGVSDGYASLFHKVDASFGMLCIAFEDLTRQNTSEFTAEEFGCDVRMQGSVRVRTSYVASDATGYSDKADDVLDQVGMAVRAGGAAYQTIKSDKFSCKMKGTQCSFTGSVLNSFYRGKGKLLLSRQVEEELGDMELV